MDFQPLPWHDITQRAITSLYRLLQGKGNYHEKVVTVRPSTLSILARKATAFPAILSIYNVLPTKSVVVC